MGKQVLNFNKRKAVLVKSGYLLLIFALILSIFNPFLSVEHNVKADSKTSAEDILASLSEEQREALKNLEASPTEGLIGFEEKDLSVEEETTVIVEFQSKPEEVAVLSSALKGEKLSNQKAKNQVLKEHQSFEKYAEEHEAQIERTYQSTFNGVAVTIPANEIEGLLEMDVIKAVYKSNTYSVEPIKSDIQEEEQEGGHMADSIPFLGVDKLHDEGITGEGVKVGVIDTGIDYNHPDLQGAFAGGYDLVDNDSDPMETTYEDWEESGRPLVDPNLNVYYTSHGTHVSGTIAAQAENDGGFKVKGVAPDAELYGYRVLGPYGAGTTETILAGIERAVNDGMDVINLSLGSRVNDPLDPTSIAINNAVLNGVVAVLSAGNNGPNPYSVGTPAAAAFALTVGASSTSISSVNFTAKDVNNQGITINLKEFANNFVTDLRSFENEQVEVVDMGVGRRSDYEGKDVRGKAVLVNRGSIGTQDKIVFAKENGAKAVFVYHDDPEMEEFYYYTGEDHRFVPTFYMTNEDGIELLELLDSGQTQLELSDYSVYETEEDMLGDFSSRGPTRRNIDIKPEVTAPGVSILSTVPAYSVFVDASSDYQFAYDRHSGTSMAAPHVAGVVALMLQENPDFKPEDIKTILMNTAVELNGENSVFDVGAGRIDPYEAVHSDVELKVMDETPILDNGELVSLEEITGGISFGSYFTDEGNVRDQRSITIENTHNKNKNFDVSVDFTESSLDAAQNGVQISVDKSVKVKKNSDTKTNVFLTVPKTAEIGIYEGYITFENKKDAEETYRIPFAFRTMEGGFNFTELSSPAISPPYLHVKHKYDSVSTVDLIFSFKSPMKKIDLILSDAETGEDLGFLATVTLENNYDGINYLTPKIFNGEYYAFTGDENNPIASETTQAQSGAYTIKAVGTSQRDLVFTEEMHVLVDAQDPSFKTSLEDLDSPVIEYAENQSEFTFDVEAHDPEIDKMMELGMDADQSLNTVDYSINNNFNPELPVGKDGKLDLTVPLDESDPFMSYAVNANDTANNHSEKRTYYFIKEDLPYGYFESNASRLKTGEEFTTTLVLENVENLKEGNWSISNFTESFELVDAKANDSLTEDENPIVNTELQGSTLNITMNTDKPLSGKVKAVDLNIKVSDSSFQVLGEMEPTLEYTDSDSTKHTIPHAAEAVKISPTFSEIYGKLDSAALGYGTNWTNVDKSLILRDQDGNEYDGTDGIDRYGWFRVSNLPVKTEPFEFELIVPGHFTLEKTFNLGLETDDEPLGQLLFLSILKMTPGDVNQDDVIDIEDAILIKEHWNSSHRNTDINFDGTVDSEDINFVVSNYLTKNPDVKDAPEPQSESNGITLEDILEELGLEELE